MAKDPLLTWTDIYSDPRIFRIYSSDGGPSWIDQCRVGGGASHGPTLTVLEPDGGCKSSGG